MHPNRCESIFFLLFLYRANYTSLAWYLLYLRLTVAFFGSGGITSQLRRSEQRHPLGCGAMGTLGALANRHHFPNGETRLGTLLGKTTTFSELEEWGMHFTSAGASEKIVLSMQQLPVGISLLVNSLFSRTFASKTVRIPRAF